MKVLLAIVDGKKERDMGLCKRISNEAAYIAASRFKTLPLSLNTLDL